MKKFYHKMVSSLNNLNDLPPLFFRLILAYGFLNPAMMKLGNIENVAEWFAGMGIPFPTLNAYLSGLTEFAGVILLLLGLATRFISIPLLFVMLVAIYTVHLGNGFDAGNNGVEIPLYYMLMLFSLMVSGAGKYSVDAILERN